MNKKQPVTFRTIALALSGLLIGPVFFSAAYGFPGGYVSDGESCLPCHSGGTVPQISITGPAEVPVDSTHTLTLVITGGPAVEGGLNVFADNGALATDDPLTGIDSGQIVHTSPKAFSGDSVSWDFIWTAPSTLGSVDLLAAGISGDGAGGGGGDYQGSTVFSIQVVPIPAAAVLFASGLALLGWARRL